MDNMELWNDVCITDTSETPVKDVKYGSRKFTAIDAYGQIKKATKLWGVYGSTWGFRDVEFEQHGDYMLFKGQFVCPVSEYPVVTSIKIGEDFAKKAYTDALTKALSYLGFNADIFMGKFDGNKYVKKEVKKEINNDAGGIAIEEAIRTKAIQLSNGNGNVKKAMEKNIMSMILKGMHVDSVDKIKDVKTVLNKVNGLTIEKYKKAVDNENNK